MFTVSFKEKFASYHLTKELSNMLPNNKEIVILCIGTDRSTGDSLGPLVGYHLHKFKQLNVYGDLNNPVHALNLEDTLKIIHKNHDNPFIVAVDACLGSVKSVGNIILNDSPLKPGAGVGKNLPEVGDASIKGIVNVSGFMEMFVLQNTRLSSVMEMSKIISNSLFLSVKSKSNIPV